MQDFRKLRVWQRAHSLATSTLLALDVSRGQAAPRTQLARSIASVPANIAEGSAQASNAQYARFLAIALGSLTESHNHLLLLEAVGAVPRETTAELIAQIDVLRPAIIRLREAVIRGQTTTHDAQPRTHDRS